MHAEWLYQTSKGYTAYYGFRSGCLIYSAFDASMQSEIISEYDTATVLTEDSCTCLA